MSAVIETPRAKRITSKTGPASKPLSTAFESTLMQLYGLLNAAWQTEDREQFSGDSDRLLAAGADLVMDLVRSETSERDSTNPLYNVAAQIKAAMLVPGDTPSAERLALVEQAGEILKHLLEDPKALDAWTPPEQEEERRIVTRDTPMPEGGPVALRLARCCAYDIAYLADEIAHIDQTVDEQAIGAISRCYGSRLKTLIGQLMSFLDQDDGVTVGDMHSAFYGGTTHFQPEEVGPND